MVGFSKENGYIHYSDEVLAKIVGLSTMECYGVVGMVSKNATEGFWELMRVENLSKGVKLTLTEDEKLNIELFVMVEYGTKISVIANNISTKGTLQCRKLYWIKGFICYSKCSSGKSLGGKQMEYKQ